MTFQILFSLRGLHGNSSRCVSSRHKREMQAKLFCCSCRSFAASSFSTDVQMAPPAGSFEEKNLACVSARTTRGHLHQKKMDLRSDKFIAFVRRAKLTGSVWPKNLALSSKNKDALTPLAFPGDTETTGVFQKLPLKALFLNHGLSSGDLLQIRSSLKRLGVSVTVMPLRL